MPRPTATPPSARASPPTARLWSSASTPPSVTAPPALWSTIVWTARARIAAWHWSRCSARRICWTMPAAARARWNACASSRRVSPRRQPGPRWPPLPRSATRRPLRLRPAQGQRCSGPCGQPRPHRPLPRLRHIDRRVLETLVPLIGLVVGAKARRALRGLPPVLAYLAEDQSFGNAETAKLMAAAGLPVPSPDSYLDSVLGYYLESRSAGRHR